MHDNGAITDSLHAKLAFKQRNYKQSHPMGRPPVWLPSGFSLCVLLYAPAADWQPIRISIGSLGSLLKRHFHQLHTKRKSRRFDVTADVIKDSCPPPPQTPQSNTMSVANNGTHFSFTYEQEATSLVLKL